MLKHVSMFNDWIELFDDWLDMFSDWLELLGSVRRFILVC